MDEMSSVDGADGVTDVVMMSVRKRTSCGSSSMLIEME